MQPQRLGTRAGMGLACLGCRQGRHYSPIRNPIKMLYQRTFYFHFENLLYANGRKNTFLCYEVNRVEYSLLVPVCQGIFTKEGNLHAELCFLYWFHNQFLEESPGDEYRITWYLSWSPCWDCAEQVAGFLATHRNLRLAILSARLYYFWDPHYQEKLRRLTQEGAWMGAMDYPEFKKCWDKFVYNGGQPFRPWKRLKRNFSFQDSKLQEILSSPGSLLQEEVFRVQFNNSQRAVPIQPGHYCRRKTYLCYQLEQPGAQEPLRGCLKNKKGRHAEICLIDEMRSLGLGKAQITCYLTWSPCRKCAQELATFKKDHPDLVLRVYASRLYFHWSRKYQQGLCFLWLSGIQMDVMDLPQFTDCWTNFVNPQRPFKPWHGLEKNSRSIKRRLRRIKESWNLQDLINDFEKLQLGPLSP
ncbi:DNA dC-_dU-editing enzyme APOBEC-3-like isoform X1 [Meriones unguiculatus]|uniref:DNA dC->dU-editing enzyme APOBEC-3-like isoform X1 n=2 Tax=Meriones unguiculatus TaxID=10047 RepID=UPI000B4EA498|nr:DNA dC->dU-editing enzyme APOBEC-3-like isoform X1 [Meriones unguiculatus]